MSKKFFLFSIIISFLVICSCKTKEITYWSTSNAPEDVELDWMEQKAIEFQFETGIIVHYKKLKKDEVIEKIENAVISDYNADVIQIDSTCISQLADNNYLEEIDINDFGGEKEFVESCLSSSKYNEKFYAVPWYTETRCIFYNKKIFEEHGLQPPTNINDFMFVCYRIYAEEGRGKVISLPGLNSLDLLDNWVMLLWESGGRIIDDSGSKAVFNSTEGADSLIFLLDFYTLGFTPNDSINYTRDQADNAFISGKTAMCISGPWNINKINNNNPDLKYDICKIPYVNDKRISLQTTSNLAILKSSKYPKEAKKWVDFLLQQDNLIDYTKNLTRMLPAKNEAFNDNYYNTNIFKTFRNALSTSKSYPNVKEWNNIEKIMLKHLALIMNNSSNGNYNQVNILKNLNKAAEEINGILKD